MSYKCMVSNLVHQASILVIVMLMLRVLDSNIGSDTFHLCAAISASTSKEAIGKSRAAHLYRSLALCAECLEKSYKCILLAQMLLWSAADEGTHCLFVGPNAVQADSRDRSAAPKPWSMDELFLDVCFLVFE